jgi:thousand and one amino acid protein kinase
MQIRKQFRETCKIQTRQYKALKAQILASTSKEEQKTVIKKLKEEQRRKLALLGDQYEQSIAEMLQKQSVNIVQIFFFFLILFHFLFSSNNWIM